MKKLALFLVILTLSFTYKDVFSSTFDTNIESLRAVAEQGNTAAQFQLGTAYYTGQGVSKNYQEAIKWYRKAAIKGLAIAQHNFGLMYSRGEGIPQDYEKAAYWYRKAAEQGDSHAQNNLGSLYKRGQGVSQDDKEANKWYQKAAEQECVIAQYNLGLAYSRGEGVPKDHQKAIKWFSEAAEQEHAEAKKELTNQKQMLIRSVENRPFDEPTMIPVQDPLQTLPSHSLENRPKLEATDIPAQSKPLVNTVKVIQGKYYLALYYARKADKSLINQLASFLKDLGYTVDKINRVKIPKNYRSQWDIRYFYDRKAANVLRTHFKEFLEHTDAWNDVKIKLKNFSFMLNSKRKIRKGRIEMWILNKP